MCDLIKGDVMGKFVARRFTPGMNAYPVRLVDGAAFDSAWEAWDALAEDRESEEESAGGPSGLLHSSWGDMHELAQPEAYDDNGVFGVNLRNFTYTRGTGLVWARTPGAGLLDEDKGICYQVTYEETYVGL